MKIAVKRYLVILKLILSECLLPFFQ